jgi:uncharacterized protein (DUF1778 family)
MTLSITEDFSIQKHGMARSSRLEARISFEQKSLFQKAADLSGRTLTDFLITTLQDKSMRIVQEHETLVLTGEDREKFIKTLLNPPAPNSKLIKAFTRHQKEVLSI